MTERSDSSGPDLGFEAEPADVAEERATVGRAGGEQDPLSQARGVGDPALEAPEADAIEQHLDVVPDGGEQGYGVAGEGAGTAPRDDVDAADRADQEREVALDEDDYR
ncbi:MAG TPA: hypothetical protein VFS29_11980 [Motilibacteraceae bacterium]|nr:hypothetical protein [Motilibacteraceae bacterium]